MWDSDSLIERQFGGSDIHALIELHRISVDDLAL
jgi:hypothetical protein